MTDWNVIQAFMAHVVPWPVSQQDPGYVNLHFSWLDRQDPTKLFKGGGWPFRSVETFIQRASWVNTTSMFKDQWYCLSLQSQVKANPKNPAKPKADRSSANSLLLKAIWIDADVGPKAGEYATLEDALKAVIQFREKHGLPQYSALVSSGNGLHAYWISKTPMDVRTWAPYAEGLRSLLVTDKLVKDPGITTDCCRLLRVPGTFNHKDLANPKPVLLLNTPLVMHDFATDLAQLRSFAPTVSTVLTAAAPAHPRWFDQPFAVHPAFAGLAPDASLQGGIDKHKDQPAPITPIFEQCGFYRHALETGGADYSEPLWQLSILGTTFMENGHEIAHAISKGHEDYSPADTQAKYDQKVAARGGGKISGPPLCSTIRDVGSRVCETCPLFGKIKSPINIKPVVNAAASGASSSSDPAGQAASIPEITVYYFPGNETACRTALDNIVAADLSTFTSGEILTILRMPDQEKPGLERWGGDLPGTTPALPADIIERAERLRWMARAGGKAPSGDKASVDKGDNPSEDKDDEQRWRRCKPPRDFCTDYITQRRGRYAARLLVGIARVPFIRDDGTIRTEPGYDPETGIFVDRAPKLTVPDEPTLDDAKAALQRVLVPFEHYVFEDPENGPLQVLAANLTALQRPYMKTAPMFVVNGVQAGTGKGQICRAIGHLVLGTPPPFMSWGHDDEEFKKRFDTMLLASPAMLVMDNCNGRVLRGDTLEMILSEGEATIRQFNTLQAITVRSRTFIMANGNNIQISGDMSRRGIKINILPRSASPESDVFPFTPEDYVTEHRDALLSDYYTIMRAYRLAGMPRSGLPAVGSFSEWERKVRDLIFWLTGHDLSGDFKKNKLDDPEQQEDAAVLWALHALFGERWFKASEADAALKRAAERRRPGASVMFHPGPKTTAAMRQNSSPTIDHLVQAMQAGTVAIDIDVLQEIKDRREQEAQVRMEDALLEATEQKFGAKLEYAKTLGTWARGIQKKFVDGLIVHRREDPHSKIHWIKVAISTAQE